MNAMPSSIEPAGADPAKYVVSMAQTYGAVTGDYADVTQVFNISGATSSPQVARAELLAALRLANAPLRSQPDTIAGIHLARPEVDEIAEWALRGEARERVGMLHDAPGAGKSVVMRKTLERLEELGAAVLAIKADTLTGVRTREDLQRELGLPAPVEECVKALAADGRVVVLIDQLDALSLTLTRDPAALAQVLNVLVRVAEIENTRVVASCRIFDLNNDPRLSGLRLDRKFTLQPLSDELVGRVLDKLGIDQARLLPAHRELLRTPLHLDLYARVVADNAHTPPEGFRSLQELYTALWRQKVETGSGADGRPPAECREALHRLVDYMSERHQLRAPEEILDDFAEAARYLAHAGLLKRERGKWAFLHETFFDYCYARRFVAGNRSLSEVVLAGPQGLFERSQVAQVLAYLRDADRRRYLEELRALLNAPGLRAHLRLLVLGWLGAVKDPMEAELRIVADWAHDPPRQAQVLQAFAGNAAWFDLLDRRALARWMASEAGEAYAFAAWYLRGMVSARPDAVLKRVRPHLGQNDSWNATIAQCLVGLEDWRGNEAVNMALDLVERGAATGWEDMYFHRLAGSNPAAGCRVARVYLDRRLDALLAAEREARGAEADQAARAFDWRGMQWERDLLGAYGLDQVLLAAAEQAPESVIEQLLPWMLRAADETAYDWGDGAERFRGDALFSHGWYEEHESEGAKFAQRMIAALSALARRDPARFRAVAAELSATDLKTAHRMLSRAYLADPGAYLDDIVAYLMADRRRLFLGDLGDDRYESHQLYAAAFVRADAERRAALEAYILAWQPPRERRALHSDGSLHVEFLLAVPFKLLSARGKRRRQELERKWPGFQLTPPVGSVGGVVGPPIEPEAQEKMSDAAWLGAMRQYDDATGWGGSGREFLKGGVEQLARSFEEQVKKAPERFYRLAQRFDAGISTHYLIAAVSGLAEADAPMAWLIDLTRRFAPRVAGPFRREVCWKLRKRAEEGVPDDLLDLMGDWALNDPDPDREWWQTEAADGEKIYGRDPYEQGLNSNRGVATMALVACALLRQPPQVERAFAVLERVAGDASLAVRSCVIEVLPWMLKYDSDRAMSIFEAAMADAGLLLRAQPTHEFLRYRHRTQFPRAKPYIAAMLAAPDKATRQAGARLACLAAFHHPDAQELAEQAVTGDSEMRLGAAQVYARNLGDAETQETCARNLRRLLNDPDEAVRTQVSHCFDHLTTEHVSELRPFIRDFLASPSLRVGAEQLVLFMKRVALEDCELTLEATQRVLDELGALVFDISTRWAFLERELAQLPLAVYNHVDDAEMKGQAMDLFERLLLAGSRSAQEALADWDRR